MDGMLGDHRRFIIRALVIWGLGMLVLTSTAYIVQVRAERSELDGAIAREQDVQSTADAAASNTYATFASDSLFVRDAYEDCLDGDISESAYGNLMVSFANDSKIYDRIRLIDMDGNGVVQVDYGVDDSVLASGDEPQDTADLAGLEGLTGLAEGQVYVSRLDSNVADGQADQPVEPTIRVATPVYHDGEEAGAVVLDYYATYLIADFRDAVAAGTDGYYLLNSDGDYIVDDLDEGSTPSFTYDDGANGSFADTYPDVWQEMAGRESGVCETGDAVYVFRSIADATSLSDASLGDGVVSTDGGYVIVARITSSDLGDGAFPWSVWGTLMTVLRQWAVLYILLIPMALLLSLLAVGLRDKHETTRMDACLDGLTGVYNRREGYGRLREAYHRAGREADVFSLCFADVDGLKAVNDTFGHAAGDGILRDAIQGMRSCMRATDFIMRYGGDEFILAFPHADANRAERIWVRIQEEYEKENAVRRDGIGCLVSVSHGIVEADFAVGETLDGLIRRADERMYAEKQVRRVSPDAPA